MPRKILPVINLIATLLLLELVGIYPSFFYYAITIVVILVLLSVWQLFEKFDFPVYLRLLVLPILLFVNTAAFASLLTSRALVQVLFLLVSIIYFVSLKTYYYYLNQPASDQAGDLSNYAAYGSFLSVFFAASAVFGLQSFLGLGTWMLSLIFAIIVGILTYQQFWINRIDEKKNIMYSLILAFIMLELVWAVSFLPLNFNVSGMVMAIYYYILVGIIRIFLLGKLNSRTVKLYLAVGLGSSIIILLTSRWK